ncbi:MAG TPA: hypothetical protein VM577_18755 [Anaerovoracaceae bacterium]|nr:hypothetical protein [Anaerovoracaceae bacterium]
MTKKTVELSVEEQKVIEDLRKQKAAEIAAEREELARKEAADKIREKFDVALKAAHAEINAHIENAREEINKAVKISEKTGVPFSSDVIEFTSRVYIPKSMAKKWPEVDYDILSDLDLYTQDMDQPGWEYWSSSSLTC